MAEFVLLKLIKLPVSYVLDLCVICQENVAKALCSCKVTSSCALAVTTTRSNTDMTILRTIFSCYFSVRGMLDKAD